ncbi:Dabb family protein [Fodinibius sediminis]|uniref:Stress responsive A/B Barrel Domain n=1 Tax=Fodinibius sediminis TaxID=1214077 RepID=A0A521D8X5_9BACT|nr:Dabb family protein [Fodinibius sediminis]SMO68133.1 Stress responsive A/B Barrel Domain [Fodinibius sediminis]
MIRHVVMWKLKDEAEGASKEKNAEKMKLILEGLKINIEEIKNVEVGINISDDDDESGAPYDVVLISDFETELDYTMYSRNEHHKKAVKFIESVIDERHFVDYKVDV